MTENASGSGSELKMYIAKNMIIGVILAVFVIILVKIVIGLASAPSEKNMATPQREDIVHPKPAEIKPAEDQKDQHATVADGGHAPGPGQDGRALDTAHSKTATHKGDASHSPKTITATGTHLAAGTGPHATAASATHSAAGNGSHLFATTSQKTNESQSHETDAPAATQAAQPAAPAHEDTQAQAASDHGHAGEAVQTFPMAGMAFVDAVIRPLEYELTQRFYGWRPNDILDFTDNVNNFQLGVLEVTRRSAVILSDRISRTGSTAAFDKNLQNAMNWFMIKSDRYWFPSAESKYKDGLKELRTYFNRLEKGEAQFYNRTDNLIPLLMAYQDLLGSCDENLVKFKEDDGSTVSFFKADDYFFYAQGVASALHTILKGIEKDFATMVDRRGGMEMLHHAIVSCHHAMELDPWVVLNSDLSSIFANHRLNMAGPISHARFYLGVLIRALST